MLNPTAEASLRILETPTLSLHMRPILTNEEIRANDGRDNIPGGIVPFRELPERYKYSMRVRFERDSGIGPLRLQYSRSKERNRKSKTLRRDEESVTWKDERFQKEFDLRNWSWKDEDASSSKTCRIQGRYENWRKGKWFDVCEVIWILKKLHDRETQLKA
ncbi:hypothetical protein H5410_059791 [Solanum commersonii]|uniref:Uncharacterized protein n=1 Tax=Solanum commersonii TaxID=4109 RepID=A0A9J5W3P5_SOLCO|nr:hypothetical protein H5410_059791 [Solanum commersonii]